MLPNYPEIEIPSKYQYRKNLVNFIENLVKKEITLNFTRKQVESLLSPTQEKMDYAILNQEDRKKIQNKVNNFIKEYQTYGNLISESAKLSETDPRYFNINDLKTFEQITDTITKVSYINKIKNFGNKVLKSYSNLMYHENGDLDENIIEKLNVIQSENLTTDALKSLFSNIKIVRDNKNGFEELLNKIIMSFDSDKSKIMSLIENENLNALVKLDNNNILVIQINDFKASEKLGNNKWCISNDESYFNSYLSGNDNEIEGLIGQHYFVFNFNLQKDHEFSHFAFTTDFSGKITAAFNKKNEDISYNIDKILQEEIKLDILTILESEINRIKNFTRDSTLEIIEKLESFLSDRDEEFSLSKVFSNPLIANFLLKEKTKINDFEYHLNYKYEDIIKQFNNIDKLDFNDLEIRTLFIDSLEYAKVVYEKNISRYKNIESVLSMVSDYDYHFEEVFFEENPDADENDLYHAALDFLKTAEDLDIAPYIQESLVNNFNQEILKQKIKKETLADFSDLEIKRLYELFKEEIPEILNKKIVDLQYRNSSISNSKNNNLGDNLASLLVKDYYMEFDHKIKENEKIVICATLLNSPHESDNKFAETYLKDYIPNSVEYLLYNLEKQTNETKRIVINAINSKEFKEKVLSGGININYQDFTYALYDKLDISKDLDKETKDFIIKNLHPTSITSDSGRIHKKKESEIVFDFFERTLSLIKNGLLDKEKVKSAIEDTRLYYGDKNKISNYSNYSEYFDIELKRKSSVKKISSLKK